MKYALVQFKDSNRNVKYLVLTRDIKGFEPSSAEDIPKREYLIKWEKSFHGDDNADYHDGYYSGTILLVGASPDEIRMKAKQLKIRLPAGFPPREFQTSAAAALKKPLRKARKRPGDADYELEAKKERMIETLKIAETDNQDSLSQAILHSKSEDLDDSVSCEKSESLNVKAVDSNSKLIETAGSSSSCQDINLKLVKSVSEMKETFLSDVSAKKSDCSSELTYSNLASKKSGSSVKITKYDERPKRKVPTKSLVVQSCDSSEGDFTGSESEDDATVLLAALQKEHSAIKMQLEDTLSENKKFKSDLKTYKAEMEKKREIIQKLKEDIGEIKAMNFNLQRQLLMKSDLNQKPRSSPLPGNVTSPLSFKPTSPFGSDEPSSSPLSFTPKNSLSNNNPNFVKKKLFNVTEKLDDLSEEIPSVVKFSGEVKSPFKSCIESNSSVSNQGDDDFTDITKRVTEDLKGDKTLQGDDERVHIGMNTYINRNFWEKTVRKQRDDSKFLKDSAQAIWGTDKLKSRTVSRKSKDRPNIATPRKVDILFAMLRGKLEARGLSKQEQETIITRNGKLWLGQKMYDCGRPPRSK